MPLKPYNDKGVLDTKIQETIDDFTKILVDAVLDDIDTPALSDGILQVLLAHWIVSRLHTELIYSMAMRSMGVGQGSGLLVNDDDTNNPLKLLKDWCDTTLDKVSDGAYEGCSAYDMVQTFSGIVNEAKKGTLKNHLHEFDDK